MRRPHLVGQRAPLPPHPRHLRRGRCLPRTSPLRPRDAQERGQVLHRRHRGAAGTLPRTVGRRRGLRGDLRASGGAGAGTGEPAPGNGGTGAAAISSGATELRAMEGRDRNGEHRDRGRRGGAQNSGGAGEHVPPRRKAVSAVLHDLPEKNRHQVHLPGRKTDDAPRHPGQISSGPAVRDLLHQRHLSAQEHRQALSLHRLRQGRGTARPGAREAHLVHVPRLL
mmetsp:Transcript_24352/g.55556  ORF Transcript_24352/g.55556 Transcript_24352/m.55556 type:complete len:224 (+) Transcript_24352:2721-3392(+)